VSVLVVSVLVVSVLVVSVPVLVDVVDEVVMHAPHNNGH
jgi:hypothetical protein